MNKKKSESCLFKRKGWLTYAVYNNGIHILETRWLIRAINLFKSLQKKNE